MDIAILLVLGALFVVALRSIKKQRGQGCCGRCADCRAHCEQENKTDPIS